MFQHILARSPSVLPQQTGFNEREKNCIGKLEETVHLAIIIELKAAEIGGRCHLKLGIIRDAIIAQIDIL